MSDIGVLNGPASSSINLPISTAVEIKVGASRFDDRRVVLFQPVDGDIYWNYGESAVVSTTNGFLVRKGQLVQLEASEQVGVYAIAASGTVNVRVQEVG